MKFSKIALILGIGLFTQAKAQQLPLVTIDSVSVIDDNSVSISWQVPNDPRIDGYYIYRIDKETPDGPSKFLLPQEASANGRLTNNFIYVDNDAPFDFPSDKPLRFYVAAFDRDVNPINISPLDSVNRRPHGTMHLRQNIDFCNNEAQLSWNAYQGWDNVSRYEILESQNGGPYTRVATVTGRTSYNRRGLRTGINYQYKIRAVSATLTQSSSSNQKSVSGSFSLPPAFVYLANATVQTNNRNININWLTDTTNLRLTYQVMSSTDNINFEEVARLDSVSYQKSRNITIGNVAPERTNYWFKIITSCSCPDTIDTTNVLKIVRLQADFVDPITNRITWNDMEGWYNPSRYYELFRLKLDPITNTQVSELILTTLAPDSVYIDSDASLAGSDGVTSYFLRTYEDNSTPQPYIEGVMSQSNVAYIYRDIKILVPGIFTPNGANPIFLPRVQSSNNTKFNMKIYNKWGKLVYETDNEFIGWDGRDRDSGDICLPGGYVYLIDVTDSTGKNYKKNGSIVLAD